jgi:predicted Zn-dependent protease
MHGRLAKLMNRKQVRHTAAPGSTFQVGPRSTQHDNPRLAQANRLLEMDEYDAAEAILRRLVAEAPAEAEYLASLAICLGRGQGRYVTAEKLAQKARRLAPEQACGWFALGYINLLGSRLDRGYYYLNESRKRDPRDPRVRWGLGEWEGRRPAPIADLARDHILNRLLGGLRRIFTDRRVVIASVGYAVYQTVALVMVHS